jgi:ABC-type lipoprotein export system ATPase subunit
VSAEPVVEARELFRVHRTAEGDAAALQGLTLTVARGEVLVVLGPSGAGKSTLLRVLAGLEPPSAGEARVFGLDLGRVGPRRRAAMRRDRVGMVDQYHEHALPPALSCVDGVALPLALRGFGRRARRTRAHALLERVGLADRIHARPSDLSGGERQRAAVCAALVHGPDLLLADEPGGELDAQSAREVFGLIGELAAKQGATVVLVSHDSAATQVADRVVRLRDGRVSDEALRGQDDEAIVVGRGGWVRLPEDLLRDAGLGARLSARAEPGRIVLEPGAGQDVVPLEAHTPLAPARRLPARRPATASATAELRHVTRRRGARVVLDRFDAVFAAGRLTALFGRSGSGKSTVLRLLAGLERADGGDVLVGGERIGGASRSELAALRRERIGVVSQEPQLVEHLSARENVALALALRGLPWPETVERADAGLVALGLGERLRQHAARLSAGERQRVAIARALVPGPELLLVDEPTSRLDQSAAGEVAAALQAICIEHGTTVICATHEPLVVARADAVVELERKR